MLICGTQHSNTLYLFLYAKSHYAKCRSLFIVMLNVMLMLMLSSIMLSVIMVSVGMFNVIILSVVGLFVSKNYFNKV